MVLMQITGGNALQSLLKLLMKPRGPEEKEVKLEVRRKQTFDRVRASGVAPSSVWDTPSPGAGTFGFGIYRRCR